MSEIVTGKRIEYHSESDTLHRCRFSIYWKTEYTPAKPEPHERGQVFFADPKKYGFPRPEEIKK
ncbi:MAG: hypothetical protein PF518_04910 [Spirochaetaceae bacterium]|jgi:hypothetical protein|nr:hypothetical protein [Spirochaetaceae bacterium]